MFVPIRDRQNMEMSTEPEFKGTCDISHAVTWSLDATRSKECTLLGTL
jgi:hypothetical protein